MRKLLDRYNFCFILGRFVWCIWLVSSCIEFVCLIAVCSHYFTTCFDYLLLISRYMLLFLICNWSRLNIWHLVARTNEDDQFGRIWTAWAVQMLWWKIHLKVYCRERISILTLLLIRFNSLNVGNSRLRKRIIRLPQSAVQRWTRPRFLLNVPADPFIPD